MIFLIIAMCLVDFHFVSSQNKTIWEKIVYGFTSGFCANNQFDCGDGTCISNLLLYDCFPDCADGIDEECWPGMVKCDKCKCVNKNDVSLKCSEGHLTKYCTLADTVQCGNGNCVLRAWILDGRNDCGDWTDENACAQSKVSCPSDAVCAFRRLGATSCFCANRAQTFNGSQCIPKSTTPSPTTTVAPTSSATTVKPKFRCQLDLIDFPTPIPISFGALFDMQADMTSDFMNVVNYAPSHWLLNTGEDPSRIDNFIGITYNSGGIIDNVKTVDRQTFFEFLKGLLATSMKATSCTSAAFAAIQKALSQVLKYSILTVFTDSIPNDNQLLDLVLLAAMTQKVKINFVISGTCATNNAGDQFLSPNQTSFQVLAYYTGGEIFRIDKGVNFGPLIQYIGRQMKQKYVVVDSRLATNDSLVQFPIDSTFDEVFISINGDVIAVQFFAVSSNAAPLNSIDLIFDSKFSKLYHITMPYSEIVQVNLTTQTISYVKVTGVSAISYDFTFLPDPYSTLNVVLDQPIFGSAVFGLIGRNFTYNYTVDSAAAVTYDGNFILNRTVSKYTKKRGYQFLTSQFIPDCRPFNLLIFGLNPCSEIYQIMSKVTYRAQEFVIANNLPGTCKVNQFDCAFNICIEASNFRNGRVDCPTGIDEAFPMDEFHCSSQFTFPAYGGIPYWCNRSGVFTCSNKLCVPYQWVHDGVDDCGDNSDELVPLPTTTAQRTTVIATTPDYYSSTVTSAPADLGEDVIYQRIFNNSCNTSTGLSYQCTDGSCIDVTKFRDCKFNCKDGSDEVCPSGYTKCSNCKCSINLTANSCQDDQVSSICKRSDMFYCQNSAYCVRLSDLLNKIQNCPDNSDEKFEYVDFCYLGLDKCDTNAVCQRTTYEPFYECICKFALNGNGTSCSVPHSRK